MNDVIIVVNETGDCAKAYTGKLTDEEINIAKKAYGRYINCVDEKEDPEGYEAVDKFYNEIFCKKLEDGELAEITEAKELKGMFIHIDFVW